MKIFAVHILILGSLLAQTKNEELIVPRDTSFTIFSSYIKEKKKFPFIKIANPQLSDEIKIDTNLVYAIYEKRKLRLDILRPKSDKHKYATVMLVHGGGWKSGDKSMQLPMAIEIASSGYIAVPVQYRLSQEALFPAAIFDLKAAIRWLRANSDKYQIDTTKIAVLGCSSGGQLVSMLGVTNNNPKFEGIGDNLEHSSLVQAVINLDGILDFTDPAESGKDDDPEKPSVGKLWLGYSFKENPGIWREASPLNYVDKYSSPFLFINSSLDRFHAGRDFFIKKLSDNNIYSEVHTFPDSPHPLWLFHPWY